MLKTIKKTDIETIDFIRNENLIIATLENGYKAKYDFDFKKESHISLHSFIMNLIPFKLYSPSLGFRENNIIENIIYIEKEGKIYNFYATDKNKNYGVNDSFSYAGGKIIS